MMTATRPAFKLRATWTGALGFGLALGLVSALLAGLDQVVPLPDYNQGNLMVTTVGFAFAGAVGGTALALPLGRSRVARFMLAGGVGLALGYTPFALVIRAFIAPGLQGGVAAMALAIVQYLILGAVVGLGLSLALPKPQPIYRLTAAGALGFGLGMALVVLSTLGLANVPAAVHTPGGIALYLGACGVVTGLVGGAALGLALDLETTRAG